MTEIVVNESKTVEHVHRNAETLKIKLVKGQKDSYGWEISCAGASLPEILTQIQAADAALKAEWRA
ncbi:hypothetical protein M0R72_11130 [Candidatus Pacearchaeota archaeon]|jgi:hypothetical protein|nr:hypothetical protein [Candidatus Pacearchaeota archaeon]